MHVQSVLKSKCYSNCNQCDCGVVVELPILKQCALVEHTVKIKKKKPLAHPRHGIDNIISVYVTDFKCYEQNVSRIFVL